MELYSSSEHERISQRTVVMQVMHRLKELIASGAYQPGDKLPTEQELSQEFGVGRSSIREAIKVFQHLGVVDARAAKGTFLQERANISSEAITWALLLGNDDLQDVIELREALETICFAQLSTALRAGDNQAITTLAHLEEQVRAMENATAQRELDRLVEADYRFHGHIFDASGNRLFRAIYSSLHAFMSAEIRSTYANMESLEDVAQDHAEIVETLRSSTPEIAQQRHQQHFSRTRRLLKLN
jgi:DNA-binding FadR family transcriptional regulator